MTITKFSNLIGSPQPDFSINRRLMLKSGCEEPIRLENFVIVMVIGIKD